MKKLIFTALTTLFFAAGMIAQSAALVSNSTGEYTITVNIKKIDSEDGNAKIQLVDEANQTVAYKAYEIVNGGTTAKFTVKSPGKYAVRYFHDENNNNGLDRNYLNYPIEGYGFSNNVGVFGPPTFNDLLFDVNKDVEITINTVYHF